MLTQHLAPAEQLTLVKVIDALQQVSTVSQFFSCLDGVFQELLAHECMACGIVQISQGSVRPRHMLLHHFPAAYLAQIRQTDGSLCSPALAYWCQHREPMAINLHDPAPGWPESMLAHARAFELCNLLSHGHTDIGSQQGSYFSFHRIRAELGPRHVALMRCLTPHLHLALLRALSAQADHAPAMPPQPPRLTPRQREVLHWLSLGKTNWEISRILGTSEDNVKYHVGRLLARLDAGNRVDAVVKAMQLQLLDAQAADSRHLASASISLYQPHAEQQRMPTAQ